MWGWSQEGLELKKFAMMASCDTHQINRPGSPSVDDYSHSTTSGIVTVISVHNTREESGVQWMHAICTQLNY